MRRYLPLLVMIALALCLATYNLAQFGGQSLRANQPPPPIPHITPLPPGPSPASNPPHPRSPWNPMPTKGDQKLLIILADFPDQPGIISQTLFYNQFFTSWPTGTFAGYYREVSYNQLRYTGDVAGITGGTPVVDSSNIAYVRLPNPKTYYANGDHGFGNSFPHNHSGVARDAVQALDAAGFDFSPFANPVTKAVENVIVIFAGRPYVVTRNESDLEATSYSLNAYLGGAGYTTTAGYTVNNYTFCPEQFDAGVQAPIGICSHEHGHSLGQDDLYDFSYTTTGDGNFDIMSYGTYGGSPIGVRPFHSGAYTKERYGWITPTTLAPGLYSLTLAPYETNAQVIKLYPNGATNSEYFLLENRQFLGFDNGMSDQGLCTGMVIWHIDQNVIQNYFDANTINTLASAGGPPHQGVVVVEADGRYDMIKPPLNYGECSDTWKVGQTWDGNSTPNSNLWNGSPSNLSVTVTGNTGGTLTLSIKVGNFIANSFQYLPVVLRQFIAGW